MPINCVIISDMNDRTNQIWKLFAFVGVVCICETNVPTNENCLFFVKVVCKCETNVPTKYGNRLLFLVVVCVRDDRTRGVPIIRSADISATNMLIFTVSVIGTS